MLSEEDVNKEFRLLLAQWNKYKIDGKTPNLKAEEKLKERIVSLAFVLEMPLKNQKGTLKTLLLSKNYIEFLDAFY